MIISCSIRVHPLLRFIYDLCVLPSALEVVRQLLDTEDIVLLASCLFSKYAPDTRTSSYDGDFVGWHQDLRYWGLESVREGRGVQIINMWLAVDQVTRLLQLLGVCLYVTFPSNYSIQGGRKQWRDEVFEGLPHRGIF